MLLWPQQTPEPNLLLLELLELLYFLSLLVLLVLRRLNLALLETQQDPYPLVLLEHYFELLRVL